MNRLTFILLAAGLFAATGCGSREFRSAQKRENAGEFLSAIATYSEFARKNPKAGRTPEAFYRIGEIYRDHLRNYAKARDAFGKSAAAGAGTDWEARARNAAENCPDYFPFTPGLKKVSGDSDSGGTHMRIEELYAVDAKTPETCRITRKIYAGAAEVGREERRYEKRSGKVFEYAVDGSSPTLLLSPEEGPGKGWTIEQNGKPLSRTVVSDGEQVKVRAGLFSDCLKIKTETPGRAASWKCEYYAPGVGLILTAAGTARGENRISELISVQRP
jgi:hypothetical protein